MPAQNKKNSKSQKFLELVQKFNEHNIRFLVAGARALAFYGYSRYTRDYDICITPDLKVIDQALDILSQLGFVFAEPVDAKMISQSINIHLVSEIDVDLLIKPAGFSFEDAWNRRVVINDNKSIVYFVSKDDLIAMKTAVNRPQDKIDLEKLLS